MPSKSVNHKNYSANVRDIFGNLAAKRDVMNDISAADVDEMEGRRPAYYKPIWPHHKEDDIDRIVKKEPYSEWQKRKYATKVEFPAEVKEIKTFTDEFSFEDARNSKSVYRKADFNYNRTRIAAD